MHQPFAKKILYGLIAVSLGIAAIQAPFAYASAAPTQRSAYVLSANVPLDSYMYAYLDKFDGLGYLPGMQTGTKPYTRLQMAAWIQEIAAAMSKDKTAPIYAINMVGKMQNDLKTELAMLAGHTPPQNIALKEWQMKAAYYDGDTLPQWATKSAYQPLNINNNGYRYNQNGNAVFSARLEGYLSPHTVLSILPRFSYDNKEHSDASLISGYVKTHVGNMAIQAGKDALWWGQGKRGSLLLTNNATPLTGIAFSNIAPRQMPKPLSFLGASNMRVMYSVLEDNRDVPYPSFLGARMDFTPSRNFTFAAALTSMVGGKGHMLSHGDYGRFITGDNAENAEIDQWNSIAGLDFRWRVPKWNGMHIYGELYGEDQALAIFIPTPSKNAETLGIYVPRLSSNGEWDAAIEWAHTTNCWYVHSLYTDGYTYKGDIMGDAMGHEADRYYAKFTRYMNNGNQIALHLEKVSQKPGSSALASQDADSVWLSAKYWLPEDLSIDTSAGLSQIHNKGYNSGENDHNYICTMKLTKRY